MKQTLELMKRLSRNANTLLEYQSLQIFSLAALAILFFLNILLSTGFVSDDAYNSQILGAILINKQGIFDRFLAETVGWFKGAGRFFPLHWYFYFIYYLTQSEILVKSIGIIVITLGLMFFCLLIGKLTKSKTVTLLSAICVPAIFQMRAWHDPLLAFTFLLPMLFLYLASSLYYFRCFVESSKKKYLVISVILHLLGLLTYESNYLFFLCHISLVIFTKDSFREKLSKVFPILFVSVGVVLISILAKTKLNPYFTNGYPGSSIHLDLKLTTTSFLYQCIAGVPLSYFKGTNANLDRLEHWEKFGILVFFITVFYGLLKQKTIPKLQCLALGSCLFFPPAIIMALSGHQEEIVTAGIGYGYIPVYFQYFGFYLIFLAAIYFLRTYLEKWSYLFGKNNYKRSELFLIFIFAFLFAHVANIHLQQNKAVAKSTHFAFLYPRQVLGDSIKQGLLDPVANEDLIFQNRKFPSDLDWFYSSIAKRPLKVCDLTDIKTVEKCKLQNNFNLISKKPSKVNAAELFKINTFDKNTWVVVYSFDPEHGKDGIAILAKLDSLVIDIGKNEILQLRAGSRFRIFEYSTKTISELSLNPESVDLMKLIEIGVPRKSEALDLKKFQPLDLFTKWYGRISPVDGTPENNVRWSSGDAELVIYSLYDEPKSITLSMEISRPGATDVSAEIKIVDGKNTKTANLKSGPLKLELKKKIMSGENSVIFTSDAKVISEDPRKIVFGIFNFSLKN